MLWRLHLLVMSVAAAAASIDYCGDPLFAAAVDALARGIDFMKLQMKAINLDAILGCRIAADQLKSLMSTLPASVRSYDAYKPLLFKLAATQKKAENLIRKSSYFMTKFNPTYFKKLGALVEPGKWNLSYPVRHVKEEFLDRRTLSYENDPYSEFNTDNCFSELLGTSNGTAKRCHISDLCWRMLNYHGLKGYTLTHQLLYLIIAEMNGCSHQLRQRASEEQLKTLEDYLCINVLRDAKEIAKTDFPDKDQDLFMEQVALCGLFGYIDFYKPLWLQNMISWQRPKGCYSALWISSLPSYYTNTSDSKYSKGKRNRREEVILEHDCLAHKTSVAISALTANIRFCIEMLPGKQSKAY